jgi:peptidoglycan-N-acetylglucosamine deacetylase
MKVLMWSVASDDWYYINEMSENDAVKKIASQVLDYVHPGAIVLMHDNGAKTRMPTIKATELIIAKLKLLGYRFVTIDELLGVSPYL